MSKKATVRRITDEEQSLLSVIRARGTESVVSALGTACKGMLVEGEISALSMLNELKNALSPTKFMSIEDWVLKGFMSDEVANAVSLSLLGDKNIYITGGATEYTTSLLKTLMLEDSSSATLCVMDTSGELSSLPEEFISRDIVYYRTDSLLASDYFNVLRKTGFNKFVYCSAGSDYDKFLLHAGIMRNTVTMAIVEEEKTFNHRQMPSRSNLWLNCELSESDSPVVTILPTLTDEEYSVMLDNLNLELHKNLAEKA
jgi:hypothetical protein